ncbi:hypothetical protein [Psychrobacillus sp. BM2]|uniref:hypothetical protein n=1 Tax=Psychrobacillus sp. BM2 TaxID=3400421 RepID=UPI003B01FF1B
MYPDLATKLIFNQTTIVEVSSDYVDTVMISVSIHSDDTDLKHRTFQLEPDEIDLFVATLNLYKNRIIGGRKNDN